MSYKSFKTWLEVIEKPSVDVRRRDIENSIFDFIKDESKFKDPEKVADQITIGDLDIDWQSLPVIANASDTVQSAIKNRNVTIDELIKMLVDDKGNDKTIGKKQRPSKPQISTPPPPPNQMPQQISQQMPTPPITPGTI